ncbi:hypothetical protein ACQ4PT_056246 [Festuca glaucescens]
MASHDGQGSGDQRGRGIQAGGQTSRSNGNASFGRGANFNNFEAGGPSGTAGGGGYGPAGNFGYNGGNGSYQGNGVPFNGNGGFQGNCGFNGGNPVFQGNGAAFSGAGNFQSNNANFRQGNMQGMDGYQFNAGAGFNGVGRQGNFNGQGGFRYFRPYNGRGGGRGNNKRGRGNGGGIPAGRGNGINEGAAIPFNYPLAAEQQLAAGVVVGAGGGQVAGPNNGGTRAVTQVGQQATGSQSVAMEFIPLDQSSSAGSGAQDEDCPLLSAPKPHMIMYGIGVERLCYFEMPCTKGQAGHNVYKVAFPNKMELERMKVFGTFHVPDSSIEFKFDSWTAKIEPNCLLPEVWMRVSGLPPKRKGDYLAVWALGTLFGKTFEVDMKYTRQHGVARLRIGCLDYTLISQTMNVFIIDGFYDLNFEVEFPQGADDLMR